MREIKIRNSHYAKGQLDLVINSIAQPTRGASPGGWTTVVTLSPGELAELHDTLHAYEDDDEIEQVTDDATSAPTTVADLLAQLDASGDGNAFDAANLIRSIGARHPEILYVENAEL